MNSKIFREEFTQGLLRFKTYGFDELGLSDFNEDSLVVILNHHSFSENKPDYGSWNQDIKPAKKYAVSKRLRLSVFTCKTIISQHLEIINTKTKKSVFISPSVLGLFQGYRNRKLKFFLGNAPFERPSFRNVTKI